MLKNENIICVSTMNWDFLWTRKQRFMDMLSKGGNRVLYVNQPFFTEGRNALRLIRGWFGRCRQGIRGRLEKNSENLYILHPPLTIPFGRFRLIHFLNQLILRHSIKKAQGKLGFKNPVLWIYPPLSVGLIGSFSEKYVIYDCVDEYSAYPKINKRLVKKAEEKLIKKADMVFVTAKGLYESKKHLNKNIFIIPNGVDADLFAKAQEKETVIPNDLLVIPKPRIGYIGAIAPWTDMDLIFHIAKGNPMWSLVLIGPMAAGLKLNLFKEVKNVYFLGRKNRQDLPNYLKGIDICLNPFKLNELTKTVNPLKVYEYLAAGKPVISVDMPEVRHLSKVVKIAKNTEEFIFLISQSLKENQLAQAEKSMELVKDYSWDKLLDRLVRHIEEYKK